MRTIPYGHQSIGQDDVDEVVGALKSDWLTQGPRIAEFEKALCRYAGAKYAVVVSSGTAALHIACLAAGVGCGNELITSAITFAASANCALYCGARPVFADVEPDTLNIDPESMRKVIRKETRAIIPVHFAGHPCDMASIYKLAKGRGIIVIEDAAHALGAEYKGSKIGSCKYSDMTIFSFHPVKAITTGEGGAVLTNDHALYKKLAMLRTHGITRNSLKSAGEGGWYYEMQALGFNYRITDIQASLGVSQLKKLGDFIKKRRAIAAQYDEAFCGNPYFDIPVERSYAKNACHLYPIRLKRENVKKRKALYEQCHKDGLAVQVHYIPVYLHPYYAAFGYKPGICPNAEAGYAGELSLPLYPAMAGREIAYVTKTVLKACKKVIADE